MCFFLSFFGGVVEQYDIAVVLSPVRLKLYHRHTRMVMMVYFCEILSLVDYFELLSIILSLIILSAANYFELCRLFSSPNYDNRQAGKKGSRALSRGFPFPKSSLYVGAR